MNFAGKFSVFWETFITEGGWVRVVKVGLVNTLLIAVLGLIIGIVFGTLIAAVKVMPKYKRRVRILDKICSLYVGFFRGTPLVVQLLIAFYVIWPLMGLTIPSLQTAIIVFGLNSAAYVSEIMRSGILSVDPGQMEAGRAVGLSYRTTMMQIVIPQAIKNILPTLGNEFIVLIKDTSVVSFIAAADLYKTFTEVAQVHYEYFVPYLAMALVYIVLVLIISTGIKIMERSLRKSDRH